MEDKLKYRSAILYAVVALISMLLVINVVLIYRNNLTIERNRQIQQAAERVKVNTLDIIRDLHLLDLGVRGYALVNNPALLSSVDTARLSRGRIFERLDTTLRAQNYPDIDRFYQLRDSVESYFTLVEHMVELIMTGKQNQFLDLLNQDRGYALWLQYKEFSKAVNDYENGIAHKAQENYQKALRNSYLLQLLLFLISAPALAYMAFYSSRTFHVSEQLRSLELEKNKILSTQNEVLDGLVKEKTHDILTQNEEITAQNEEIRAHNDQLVTQQQEIVNARLTIEKQAEVIQRKNQDLTAEVERQTHHLRETNFELVEQNSRLEQFAFIISHNLRAPLARVQGLASILKNSTSAEEREKIVQLLVQSSQEFDTVISDLSNILSIQKSNTRIRSEVKLAEMADKVIQALEDEIKHVHAIVKNGIAKTEKIHSLPPYIESIFYNLVSNAIKYRDPTRPLEVNITSAPQAPFVCVTITDNGLGIDLQRHRDQLFSLYKRFHLHAEGKGLGLYLVKTQMEALGGRIEVDSEVNVGTTFRLFFK